MNKDKDYTEHFKLLYTQLNLEQKIAVDTIEGPVFVIAGPGTGKTQMLTLRIANILHRTDVNPENILALTFTNAGVVAMRTRLASIVGPEAAYRTGIHTFHSFCEDQITRQIEDFEVFYGARVVDDIVRTQIVEEIIRTGTFTYLRTFASDGHYVREVLSAIDVLKREGVVPAQFDMLMKAQEENTLASEDAYYKRNGKNFKKGDLKPGALKHVEKNRELRIVYEAYQEQLHARKLYDFADMIVSVVEKIETDEVFRTRLQEKYLYLLVDEHQDTNDAQNRLILSLGNAEHLDGHPNIFAVGDAKQSIYRFQGASVENFQTFDKHFRDVVRVELTENYRSGQKILDVAHSVMQESATTDVGIRLHSATDIDAQITINTYPAYEDEIHGVIKAISGQIADGVAPQDIALFYRKNTHLNEIAAVCEQYDVPYTVASVQNALTDPDLQKLFWLLRAAANPMASNDLGQAMLIDFVALNRLDVLALFHRHARGRKKIPLAMLAKNEQLLKKIGITKCAPFKKFMLFLERSTEQGTSVPFDLFFENFVRESGFLEYVLMQKNHKVLLRKLTRVFQEVKKNARSVKSFHLQDFLLMLDMMERYNIPLDIPWDAQAHGIRLMTAHGSKGLEFAHVYITNAVESIWGKKRNMQKFKLPINCVTGDIEDERRLFYVALTRAKKSITITQATFSAQGKEQMPVQFLSEIPHEFFLEREIMIHASGVDIFAERHKANLTFLDKECLRTQILTKPLSASTLNNYYTDPLVYFFRNIVRLPSAEIRPLIFGNLIHGALEDYFLRARKEGSVSSQSDLLAIFDRRLERELILHDEYDRFEARGQEALSAYSAQHGASFSAQVHVEEWIGGVPFTLENGEEIILVGKIDKMEILSETKGGGEVVRVVDYKTGTPWSKQTKDGKIKLRRQMTFYKLLLDNYADGQYTMHNAQLHFIEPNSKGVCEIETYVPTEEDVVTLTGEINAFVAGVLSDDFLTHTIKKTRDTEQLIPLWETMKK